MSFAMPMTHQPWPEIDTAVPPTIDPECAAAVLMGYSSTREPSSVEVGAIQEAMCLALLVQVGHRSRTDGLGVSLIYQGEEVIEIRKARLPCRSNCQPLLSIPASVCVCMCGPPCFLPGLQRNANACQVSHESPQVCCKCVPVGRRVNP